MQRIMMLTMVILLWTAVTITDAKTCVGKRLVSVAFYSNNDLLDVMNAAKSMRSGGISDDAGRRATGAIILGMVKDGRAVRINGIKISNVQIENDIAFGFLPNGRKVWVFPANEELHCGP
jgi:hypothetical protein